MDILWIILAAVIAGGIGGFAGFKYRQKVAEAKIGRAEDYAKTLYEDAVRKAEDYKKERFWKPRKKS